MLKTLCHPGIQIFQFNNACHKVKKFVWLVCPVTEYSSEFDNTLSGPQMLLFIFMLQDSRKVQKSWALVATLSG